MFTCNWVMLLAVECFKCGFKAGDSAGSAVTVGSAREELSVFALFLHLQEATGCFSWEYCLSLHFLPRASRNS